MARLFENLRLLAQIARREPFGIFTDFDGTISDIAATPGEARISPLCHRYLSSLVDKIHLVAVVSGRPVMQLAEMVGISQALYIGNHGLERLEGGEPVLQPGIEEYVSSVREALDALKEGLGNVQGIVYEDKGPVVAVHYRGCSDSSAVEAKISSLLEGYVREGKITLGRGRKVVEIRPPIEFSKGLAVLDLIRQHSLRAGIYIGDDLTDVDAILQMKRSQRGSPFVGVGVAVVEDEAPPEVAAAADYSLQGPREVEKFLRWLDEAIA